MQKNIWQMLKWLKDKTTKKDKNNLSSSDNNNDDKLENNDNIADSQNETVCENKQEKEKAEEYTVRKKKHIEFDLFGFFLVLKKRWWVVGIFTLVFGTFGVWVAFQIPRIYKANILLAPETANNSMLSNVSSLAAMVGLYNDANPTGDAIYPEIYPELMNSNDFLVNLFDIKVTTLDKKTQTTYYDYLTNHQEETWWGKEMKVFSDYIKKNFMKKNQITRGDSVHVNPFELTEKQSSIVKSMKEDILCSVDKKTNIINIEITAQDPLVAATIADSVKNKLQKSITKYKTSKARNDLKYMEGLSASAKADYEKARRKYAAYCDANQEAILESIRSEQENLENDMQLKYNIYTQLVQQLQIARAKLQEKVPAFTVVQSASVPIKHSNTPKIYILAVFLFIGWIICSTLLIIKYRKEILIIRS